VIRQTAVILLFITLTAQTVRRIPSAVPFVRSLTFAGYTFKLVSGRALGIGGQFVEVEAARGSLLLTRFKVPTVGDVVGAEVADLDHNRFPELYIFTQTTGSGSFGFVQGWQFLPQRRATVTVAGWQQPAPSYMGHDSLWTENGVLCRRFPQYNPGDANAYPTGGMQLTQYQLVPDGQNYRLQQKEK
jgi:hypothetical protein